MRQGNTALPSDGVVVRRASSAGGIAEQEAGLRWLARIASTMLAVATEPNTVTEN